MKRTGIKKLELKRLTVKQLAEVDGAGCQIVTRFCSQTCTCMTSAVCNNTQAGHAADNNSYYACDYVALGISGCDGHCRTDDSDIAGSGGGGSGSYCGSGS